jgi:hypothetical protein
VPVEVHDGPDGAPEVVGYLCPDCREKRRPPTPKEARVAAQKRATADVFGLTPKPYLPSTGDMDADLAETQRRLRDLALGFPQDQYGAAVISKAEHAEYQALVEHGKMLMDAVKVRRVRRMLQPPCGVCGKAWEPGHHHRPEPLTVPGPYDADPAPPVVEIEQGGWVYSLGWNVDIEDLCDDDDHEWEALRTASSVTPFLELCSRCGVKRRRAQRWLREHRTYQTGGPIRSDER